MSLKTTLHCTPALRPKLSSKYVVFIEGLMSSPLQVEECEHPLPKIESTSVNFLGRQYNIPISYDQQGTWSCTIPETMFMSTMVQSSLLLESTNRLNYKPRKIYIYLLDDITGLVPVYYCVLRDCFLNSITSSKLAWQSNTPVKYTLSFTYSSITRFY